MRKIKVVYWDFDGVLRPDRSLGLANRDGFDPDCVARANLIHSRTGALAVVSSTWRRDQRCRQIMAGNGFDAPLLTDNWMTPDDRCGHGDRADDIDAHMAQCLRMGYAITGFAIVDDLFGPAPDHLSTHLVTTCAKAGITDPDVALVLAALSLPVSADCYA